MSALDVVVFGLSITSSWGNGHATTYRGLLRELAAEGHRVTFFERDLEFYASNRDMPQPPYCTVRLYRSLEELAALATQQVREADLVVVGSYVPEGVAVARWVLENTRGATAFYDIDTPVTLAKLARGEEEYLSRELIPEFDLYLSFTGGPTLRRLERIWRARRAEALYCSVDPELYYPESSPPRWDLGYLGTYSADRQPALDALLVEPARRWREGRFHVAGPQYPESIAWPANVEREIHLPPRAHRAYYCAQRFTLNVTRRDMIAAGFSPSVRLFEAAACGVPIVSDVWPGLESFLVPGREILVAAGTGDVLRALRQSGDDERARIAAAARRRGVAEHTAAHRAETLARLARETLDARAARAATA